MTDSTENENPADELGVDRVQPGELFADDRAGQLDRVRGVLQDRLGENVTVHRRMVEVRVPEKDFPVEYPSLRIVIRDTGIMRDALPEFVKDVVERASYELAKTRRLYPRQSAVHMYDESKLLSEREYHVVTWDDDSVAVSDSHRRPANQETEFPK